MLIKLEKINKDYQTSSKISVRALSKINLIIEPGEFTALVGPSGSGKTTLFNILGCIDKPSSGDVYFDSECITNFQENKLRLLRREKIGYIFQFFNLIPTLTAFENATLPFWEASYSDQARYKENCMRLFDQLEISNLKDRYPKELSGGQQQRVAIARSLVHFPQLVVADEPTGNLDSKTSEKTIELLKSECSKHKAAFVVATHDLSILHQFDKVVFLKDGKIEKVEKNSKGSND